MATPEPTLPSAAPIARHTNIPERTPTLTSSFSLRSRMVGPNMIKVAPWKQERGVVGDGVNFIFSEGGGAHFRGPH